MARLHVTAPALRQLQKLPAKVQPAMWELIHLVAENPLRAGAALRRELAGQFAAWRGPYRVLYRVHAEADVVEVLAVAHRAASYRRQ